MRVVLDTNVFISATMIEKGKPAQILKQKQKFILLANEEILKEIQRVLSYPRIRKRHGLNDKQILSLVRNIKKTCMIVRAKTNEKVVRADPDDDKFIACAKQGNATYIISGDPHLTNLKKYEGIRILKPAEFLDLLNRLP